MASWLGAIPYFPEHELACKCCGLIKLDYALAVHLPLLRVEWDSPLSPSSVCRCPQHNTNEGGHPRSLHLTENPVHDTDGSAAVDVKWASWDTAKKLRFAKMAYRMGWSVGLHVRFCHIDRRGEAGLRQACYEYSEWDGVFGKEDVIG